MISAIAMWLAMAGGTQQPKTEVFNLACQSGQGMIIDNHGGKVDGVDVDGDTTVGCLIYSDNDKVTNVTINRHHYDRCGPTRNGVTPCITKGPTKIVDAYCEGDCHGIDPPYVWEKKGAEHVIEIRTKRASSGNVFYCGKDGVAHCDDGRYLKHSADDGVGMCSYDEAAGKLEKSCKSQTRTVKTLWIDGQKIGTIREVEEK